MIFALNIYVGQKDRSSDGPERRRPIRTGPLEGARTRHQCRSGPCRRLLRPERAALARPCGRGLCTPARWWSPTANDHLTRSTVTQMLCREQRRCDAAGPSLSAADHRCIGLLTAALSGWSGAECRRQQSAGLRRSGSGRAGQHAMVIRRDTNSNMKVETLLSIAPPAQR